MTRDERLQLADQVVLQAERKIGVDPFNQSAQAKLLQPPDLVESERLIGEVGQRRAAPQSERVAQQRRGPRRVACRLSPLPLVETLLEAVNVQLASLNVECVTSRLGPQTVVAQCATQLRDVVLEDLRRRRGRPLTPKLVDQPVRRERLVRMDQQERQQRTLLATPERDRSPLIADLERTEDVEIHVCVGDRSHPRRRKQGTPNPPASPRVSGRYRCMTDR